MKQGFLNLEKTISWRKLLFFVLHTVVPHFFAFFVPFFLSIFLFKANNFYPFVPDGQTLLMIDMQGQYIAFFRYYKMMLAGDVDLFYTLGKATGGDMLSIFTYYLASPFNLLLHFYSLADLPKALMHIVVLKLGFTGLTAYYALTKITGKKLINLVFAVSYALISYNFIYYSNIMWLDGVILLPLIVYGLIRLKDGKSPLLYLLSLALTIITSWYIGIMVAIFSVLFFIVLYVNMFNSRNRSLKPVITFGIASLLAGLLSLAFWGSALVGLMGTKGGNSLTNLGRTLYEFYDIIAIERGFSYATFPGMSAITGQGIAIYAGALPLILSFLFFFNKEISAKLRILFFALVGFYIFSFFNVGLDHLMHGGPAPNWFPGRYTFILGFLLIYLGALNLNKFKGVPVFAFIVLILSYTIFAADLEAKGALHQLAPLFFSLIFILLVVYSAFLYLSTSKFRENKVLPYLQNGLLALLTLVALINVYGNNNHILATMNDSPGRHLSLEAYSDDERLSALIEEIKNNDSSLYRLEKSFIRSGSYNNANNDAMYYGYNGISHYSSSEKSSTQQYLKKLGFHYNGFNLNYENGSTLAMNSYLGVKYVLDNGTNSAFDFVRNLDMIPTETGSEVTTYQNKYALPFLFPVEQSNYSYTTEGVRNSDETITWYDIFEYQNAIFQAMTNQVVDTFGNPKPIFKKADYTKSLSQMNEKADEFYFETTQNGTISYHLPLLNKTERNYYYYFYTNDGSKLRLTENGSRHNYFSYHSYQINGIRQTKPLTTLTVNTTEALPSLYLKEAIYYEDLDVLAEYIAAIKGQADVSINQVTTSNYHATVTTKADTQTMLLTLPSDNNLNVYVNGKKVQTFTRFNIYTAFNLPSAGTYTVKIVFEPLVYQIGLPVGIFLFAGTIFTHFYLYTNVFKQKRKKETTTA